MTETVRLTIDGLGVEAPDGSTVLDAARKLGIRVPTLCHRKGTKAFQSCFICLVQVEGRPTLSAACSTRALEGMVALILSGITARRARTAVRRSPAAGSMAKL